MMTTIRQIATAAALLLLGALVLSCSNVPLTGRRQLNIIPGGTMLSMSSQQYTEFLKTNKPTTNQAQTQQVQKVGKRIQAAVEQYFRQNNLSEKLNGYQWEFNVVESKEVNAWCMPGGKVVVYTGILPVTKTDEGLAVVMGHEIAHAVAEHGSERMSQQLLTQFGGMALEKVLESKPQQTQQVWMTVFGAGAQYGVLLPFSREQESEADHLGLVFMAMAGYNPSGAVDFWQRMSQQKSGQAPPEFMSTHPSDETRIGQIKQALPEAMRYYKPGK
jgi:predicted Zn-dependent protease